MSDRTTIEWTATRNPDGTVTPGASWNPLRAIYGGKWYCEKLSPGCDHCYASTFNRRLGGMEYPRVGAPESYQRRNLQPVRLDAKALDQPSRWKRPRRIFVCSMTDLFGEWITDDQIDQVFATMLDEPRHTFMVLTKRPSRMAAWWERSELVNDVIGMKTWPAHIWAGTTIESEAFAWRANVLRRLPAPIRFVSAEPLLSELANLDLDGIAWLIVGGESGPGRREFCHPAVRDLVDRGHAAGTAVFVKQDSGPRPGMRPDFLGELIQEWPEARPC